MSDPLKVDYVEKVEQKFEDFSNQTNLKGEGLPNPTPKNNDSRNIATLVHLSHYLFGFIVPLVIFLVIKDDEYVIENAKEDLNLSLTLFIYGALFTLLSIILIGLPFLLATFIFSLIAPVVMAINSSNGKIYRFPYLIRFIK